MSSSVSPGGLATGDQKSTTRPRRVPSASIGGGDSIDDVLLSVAVPLITPIDLCRLRGAEMQFHPTPSGPAPRTLTGSSGSFRTSLKFATTWHGVELKPVTNEFIAELISDYFLQPFDLFVT